MNRTRLFIMVLLLLSIDILAGCGRKTDPVFSPGGSIIMNEQDNKNSESSS